MGFSLLSILCCIWDVISEPVNRCLGRAADDSLGLIWGRLVASARDYTRFWGNQVEQVPVSTTCDLAGLDEIRAYEQEIVSGLRDDRVGVIGIHGMGGVGKTTLLERINNNFRQLGAPGFQVVIWVTVSREVNLLEIQKSIAERIGLTLTSDDPKERSRHIFKALCNRRFLLLVDDLWEEINLKDIGIPRPTTENKCKVILTTRSRDVCHQMGAKKVLELKVLNESESWKLFKENVGTEVDLDAHQIKQHAETVVDRCGGLPLALITVGRAMANVKSEGEWKEALRQLSQSPHELSGMTNKVLSLLKFSYDRLEDETLKQCLSYCCLYPEDYRIRVEDIIEQWIGEGFLDKIQSNNNRVTEGRNRGRGVITRLVKASLLQYAHENEKHVKMHDVVREMCLWITGEDPNADKNNAFLVLVDEEWSRVSSYSYERWKNKMRISLMYESSFVLPDSSPSCPHLRSLFFFRAQAPEYSVIPQGFFCFMPVLRVLDLSHAYVRGLPDDVGLLTELRYLNLDHTPIESLPRGFGKLTSLILLSLNYTWDLTYIPPEAVPVITNVRVLRMYECGYDLLSQLIANPPTVHDDRRGGERYSITPPASSSFSGGSLRGEYYDCWKNLEEVGLFVTSRHSLEVLLSSDTLRRCCVDVRLSTVEEENIPAEHLSVALRGMQNLRRLSIYGCRINGALILDAKGDFGRKLEQLWLHFVHDIRDIAWVRDLPCIRTIYLSHCNGIEEGLPPATTTVGGDDDDSLDRSSLRSLRWLTLQSLPALSRISSRPMLFPSLEVLKVINCSNLEELPLTASSAPNLRDIRCSRRLWESLGTTADGGNTSLQSRLLPFYTERD